MARTTTGRTKATAAKERKQNHEETGAGMSSDPETKKKEKSFSKAQKSFLHSVEQNFAESEHSDFTALIDYINQSIDKSFKARLAEVYEALKTASGAASASGLASPADAGTEGRPATEDTSIVAREMVENRRSGEAPVAQILFRAPEALRDDLKRLSISSKRPMDELLIEAALDLLKKYGGPVTK